jgi:DNA-binding transcriptional regulator GbsR (MarR family)
MVAPFEGLFGDTSELRTIQFLLPVSGLRFNISELARETRISRQTMMRVVAKLTKWNVLKIAGRHGGANYYALNQDSGFIKAFEDLDNLIIEQMEDEQCPVVSSLRPEGHDLSMAAQIPQ